MYLALKDNGGTAELWLIYCYVELLHTLTEQFMQLKNDPFVHKLNAQSNAIPQKLKQNPTLNKRDILTLFCCQK
jgi:hypothetical protein